jgi:PTH1 family peptidyl-tRNA hydrolase
MELCGLIVGLGNPGAEYDNTRHNFGFMVVEALLAGWTGSDVPELLSRRKDPFFLWRVADRDSRADWLFCMPQTWMNRSGEAVQRAAARYRIAPQRILVLHDELDLPLGRMKLKPGGGNAGHNGLRSIQQMLGSPDFYRLRLGIGKPVGRDGASYVLGRFAAAEREPLAGTIAAAARGVLLFMREGEVAARQFCNGFSLEPRPSAVPASGGKTGESSGGGDPVGAA